MENQIIEFTNKHFGKIRVIDMNGQPWFVGKDIADALGYSNTRKALTDHVAKEDKNTVTIRDGIQGNPNKTVINESGLYSLILSCKLKSSKAFKQWVTAEVLPSIRKHGAYLTDEVLDEVLQSPEFAYQLFTELEKEKHKTGLLVEKIFELEPKASYCEAVLESGGAIPATVIAKDYGYTTNAFNSMLHGFRVQYKVGGVWCLYRQFAGKGYVKTRTCYVEDKKFNIHTHWTQKGRLFLYEYLKQFDIFPLSEIFDKGGKEDRR